MKMTILLTFLLAFALISIPVYAYEFLSVYQDDGSSDFIVEAPSFYWPGGCEVDINLLVTASSGATYSLSNQWFSPNQTLIATSVPVYSSNINCLSQGIANADSSLNNFYESRSETISTASSTDTWVRTIYNCTADANNLITYSNTNVLDAYNAFPYGYIRRTGGYCQVGTPGALPSLESQLSNIITNIEDGYDTVCSSTDLEKAEVGGASSNCAFNRFYGTTFWYYVPFNSGSSGLVNVSITEVVDLQTGTCNGVPAITCVTNKTYLYNTFLDTNTSIGTSLPLNQNLVLQRNTDFWLLIGTECTGATGGSGSCTTGFNHTDYEIDILDCEPTLVCGDWSECSGNIQTRTCEDISDCNVPATIETRSCFDVPAFDLTLGFEEFNLIDGGVYICTKGFVVCSDVLSTIAAQYPVNWTVFPDFDGSGIARDNFIKMSAETASVGSRSLKMWYIPPKINEPISDGGTGTVCGNGTIGSFPEVQHPYNDSLFISQNITFNNPFAQIRYDVRKCAEPVLQYDYTGDLLGFNCGEMCYASSCNDTPKGRYGVRISRLAGQLDSLFPAFSMFNETDNVTSLVIGSNISTRASSTLEPGFIVNSTENIFVNGTRINLLFNLSDSVPKNLCVYQNSNEIGRILISAVDVILPLNITLANLSGTTNEINISSCGGADDDVFIHTFNVENFINLTTSAIVYDYVGFAPDTWDAGQIIHDLSNINLETGVNYTISLSVNPENQFDPATHCVYMDNFRVTFTELALPECISECLPGSIDRRIGSLSNGVCTFIIQTNSPDCIGDQDERQEVDNILLGLGGGDITDNSTCIDSDNDGISDDLYIFDTALGRSEIILDSAACLLLINQTAEELRNTEPLSDTSAYIQFFSFLFSPIFIYIIFSLLVSGILSSGIARITQNGDGVFQVFGVTMLIFILLGSLPGIAIIPIWISIAIIAIISLLVAQKLRGFAFSGGGG